MEKVCKVAAQDCQITMLGEQTQALIVGRQPLRGEIFDHEQSQASGQVAIGRLANIDAVNPVSPPAPKTRQATRSDFEIQPHHVHLPASGAQPSAQAFENIGFVQGPTAEIRVRQAQGRWRPLARGVSWLSSQRLQAGQQLTHTFGAGPRTLDRACQIQKCGHLRKHLPEKACITPRLGPLMNPVGTQAAGRSQPDCTQSASNSSAPGLSVANSGADSARWSAKRRIRPASRPPATKPSPLMKTWLAS